MNRTVQLLTTMLLVVPTVAFGQLTLLSGPVEIENSQPNFTGSYLADLPVGYPIEQSPTEVADSLPSPATNEFSLSDDPPPGPLPDSSAGLEPLEEWCDDSGCTEPGEEPTGCTTPGSGCSGSGGSKKKDGKKKDKPNPCAKSHKPLFYLNDFSYLNDPEYDGCCLGDSMKQLSCGAPGNPAKLDIGGQLRLRYHYERGMGQQSGTTRFENTENNFLLLRTRLYGNLQATENIRIFAEGIYADVTGANDLYIPRGIDRNWGDFLNLFADLKMTDHTTVRLGRQELLFSAQRLVSPLDWANVRRTFEGVRVMQKYEKLSLDWFYTNFVPVVRNELDEADYDRSFYGMYSSYKGESETLDVYYLGFDNQTSDFSIHTIGSRLWGGSGQWLYDFEGGAQFGRQSGLGLEHEGAYGTAGIGRKFKNDPWKSTMWFYYDYASGNNRGGDFNRFNQLFPLAHKYLGFIDAVQRANIESFNVLWTMQPSKKLKLLFWYYHLMSNQDNDVVPAIGGTPAQSLGSKDLGDTLDILGSYSLGPRSNLVLGYSRFWRGNKILGSTDADFGYVQYQVNF